MSNTKNDKKSNLPSVFQLERYFSEYEHTMSNGLLCCSDPQSMILKDLLEYADSDMLEAWHNLSLAYTEARGNRLLLKEIATRFYSPKLSADNILEVVPVEGIYLAMRCAVELVQKSQNWSNKIHAVCTWPRYQSLSEILETCHVDLTYWKAQKTADTWNFSLDELRDSILQTNTRILVINFPHNPTGFAPPNLKWINALLDLCRERNIVLFSDEMFKYLVTNEDILEEDYSKTESICCLYENAVTLSGLSKCFGLPGLRVGWLATQNKELLNLIEQYKDYTTICASAPSEILGIIALRASDKIIPSLTGRINSNLCHLNAFMNKHKKAFIWRCPNYGSVGLVELTDAFLNRVGGCASAFCEILQKRGVLLLPGKAMQIEDRYFRIGFGRDNVPILLDILEKCLQDI